VGPLLGRRVAPKAVLTVELAPGFARGDDALCAFGPGRRQLLMIPSALAPHSAAMLREVLRERVLEISPEDAALGAANAFALNQGGECVLVLPEAVSARLRDQVRERGATPIEVHGSGPARRGSPGVVKALLADLGPIASDRLPWLRPARVP
jgi:hypothetical protein